MCPPGLSFLSYGAIAASCSGGLAVVANMELMAITGLRNLVKSTSEIQYLLRQHYGINHIGILGIIINEYVPRSRRQRSLKETIQKFIPIERFESTIPSRESCDVQHLQGRLYSMCQEQAVYDSFDLLVDEIIQREIVKGKETESRIITVDDLGKELEYEVD